MKNIIELLQGRGFIEAMTSEDLVEHTEKFVKVYAGFDPTADSLHVGNLIPIMGLAWFQKMGHTPVALVGGATGLIGDPSGKNKERKQLDSETVEKNLEGIQKNLETILDFNHPTAKPLVVNNYDWFKKMSFVDFLRDIGKYFRVGIMMAKDSVKSRLSSEEGMSFTEFSYQTLQGYDFLYLMSHEKVTIQMGGSDQWGNITAGTELIRKVTGKTAHGITFPLLTMSDGKKFGKSEEGNVWLSPHRTSPYQFYQYFIRLPDADITKMMRLLTFMSMEEIEKIDAEMKAGKAIPNSAQKRLAEEVTKIVHGEEGLKVALKATEGMAPGSETLLDVEVLENLANSVPCATLSLQDIEGKKYIDLTVASGLLSSKGEARRLVRNGGAYLNNQKISDENRMLSKEDLVEGRLLLLGAGKKKKMLVKIQG